MQCKDKSILRKTVRNTNLALNLQLALNLPKLSHFQIRSPAWWRGPIRNDRVGRENVKEGRTLLMHYCLCWGHNLGLADLILSTILVKRIRHLLQFVARISKSQECHSNHITNLGILNGVTAQRECLKPSGTVILII